jgi:lipopolysaccharide transport system permease protein
MRLSGWAAPDRGCRAAEGTLARDGEAPERHPWPAFRLLFQVFFPCHQQTDILSERTMNQPNTLVIEPGLVERNYWRDLWRYRELFYILAWRDIAVRYKQTVIGAAWALIQPFLAMVVFTVIFGKLAKLPTDGSAPYALMVYAALLPWQLFSSVFSGSAGSLLGNANLISKVYFPRLIVPTARGVVALVDFLISLVVLVILMGWYRFLPSWHIALLPLFVVMALLASLGPGLWATALNVKYRDFAYIIPFVIQAGQFISPVGFTSSVVKGHWRLVYSLNPVAGVIDGFRWAILGGQSKFYMPGFLISWGVILLLLWLGIRKFRKTERTFADLI